MFKNYLTREDKKSLCILFITKPLIRTEAEKIIPTCKDDEEILDYFKELLKLAKQSLSQDIEVATDPVVNDSSKRNPNDTYLPENAFQLLRYYELWNKPYKNWPSLHEYSGYLHDVRKDRIHDSFKKEVEILKKLFSKEAPEQIRLSQLEGQLKSKFLANSRMIFVSDCSLANKSYKKLFSWCRVLPCEARYMLVRWGATLSPKIRQIPRNIKKAHRRKVSKATKLLSKKEVIKEELELAKARNSVIVNGYHRINKHYKDFHQASTQLVKRNLSDVGIDADIDEPLNTKKVKTAEDHQPIRGNFCYASSESTLPSGTLPNEEIFIHAIKKYNTCELIEYLRKKDLKLNDDNFTIIRKEKIAGLDFLELTKEEFRSVGFALGPATRLVKFITEVKKSKVPPHELDLKQSGNFQEDNDLETAKKNDSDTVERNDSDTTEKMIQIPTEEISSEATATNEICEPCVNESISISEKITADTYLPENASQLLRYYDIWNRPYIEWPTLDEFSNHLQEIYNIFEKSRVHSSFKLEIGVLKKIFAENHPAQIRISEMENQLKVLQMGRSIKQARKRNLASSIKVAKLISQQRFMKSELQIAKDNVIMNGYHRINEHYEDLHEASAQLIKRNLFDDVDESLVTKKVKTTK
ncbi:hypothetical protein Glove_674g7 [Diversispora epigaea]|uniref:SAM domain-containing protein n=1 Tax=Diversispora epigaea TaxID=1348612 RepID=A0A397G7X8_9GLOM|nr:hypothetical protein Glove_674g7 [Diversispora epigaea]